MGENSKPQKVSGPKIKLNNNSMPNLQALKIAIKGCTLFVELRKHYTPNLQLHEKILPKSTHPKNPGIENLKPSCRSSMCIVLNQENISICHFLAVHQSCQLVSMMNWWIAHQEQLRKAVTRNQRIPRVFVGYVTLVYTKKTLSLNARKETIPTNNNHSNIIQKTLKLHV